MGSNWIKAAIGLVVVALIAYFVALRVVANDTKQQSAAKERRRGKGDKWQAVLAVAPEESDDLGGLAG